MPAEISRERHAAVYRMVHGWLLSGRQNGHILLVPNDFPVLEDVLVLLQGDTRLIRIQQEREQRYRQNE